MRRTPLITALACTAVMGAFLASGAASGASGPTCPTVDSWVARVMVTNLLDRPFSLNQVDGDCADFSGVQNPMAKVARHFPVTSQASPPVQLWLRPRSFNSTDTDGNRRTWRWTFVTTFTRRRRHVIANLDITMGNGHAHAPWPGWYCEVANVDGGRSTTALDNGSGHPLAVGRVDDRDVQVTPRFSRRGNTKSCTMEFSYAS